MIADPTLNITNNNQVILPEVVIQKKNEIKQQLILKIFAECAWTAASTTITACFIATPMGLTLLISANALTLIFNISAQSFLAYREYSNFIHDDLSLLPVKSFIALNSTVNAVFSAASLGTLFHEIGHVVVAKLVYKTSCKIEITFLLGGFTSIHSTVLSELGNKIGRVAAQTLVSAAGPAVSVLLCSICAGIGVYQLTRSKDRVSEFTALRLVTYAGLDTLNTATYALSALFIKNDPAHDFLTLWRVGNIHPIAAVVTAIAIPAITASAVYFASRRRETS